MDPNWIGGLATFGSACFALVSLFIAGSANRRAEDANRHAAVANERSRTAVALQHRIDERAREFRMVEWGVEPSDGPDGVRALTITNVGLSEARAVTVVLALGRDRETFDAPVVRPGEAIPISSIALAGWLTGAWEYEIVTPKALFHWSSPLGHASTTTVEGKDVGDYVDFSTRDE